MMRFLSLLLSGAALYLSALPAVQAETAFLDVEITYRERMALPPDAQVDVELLDTSRADAPSVRMASQRFAMQRVPLQVRIGYDPALIEPRNSYTVAARILSAGEVLFRTTTAYPALTRDAPDPVKLVLERMADAPQTSKPDRISGVAWEVSEIGGRAISAEDPPTLTVDDAGRFGLYGGCNRFTGQIEIDAGEIAFPEQFAGTMMACAPPRDRLERETLQAFMASTGYLRDGKRLTLTDPKGVVTIRLVDRPR